MSEMVERVAVTIAGEHADATGTRISFKNARLYARAAIAAMREPTEGMITKGAAEHTGYYDMGNVDLQSAENASEIWHAMIDEALVLHESATSIPAPNIPEPRTSKTK